MYPVFQLREERPTGCQFRVESIFLGVVPKRRFLGVMFQLREEQSMGANFGWSHIMGVVPKRAYVYVCLYYFIFTVFTYITFMFCLNVCY